MQITVVIPTCNRKKRLISLLGNLNESIYPIYEVIIVDSGEERLVAGEYSSYSNLKVLYLDSEKSVCIQRNKGIYLSSSEWILLCDDDIEMPRDYISKLADHVATYPNASVVSGLWLQLEKNGWTPTYPETSSKGVVWKFIFQLGIWGEINCEPKNPVMNWIVNYYKKRANYITKAGWPVLTNFSGSYFKTPLYSLGAALIKRECLLNSLYDEVLDRNGMGDNYGVTMGLPCVQVITDAHVYHHREEVNRLEKPLQFYRRALALDYFRKSKKANGVSKTWLVWSLFGNFLMFMIRREKQMIKPAFKTFWQVAFKKNPYYYGAARGQKILEPVL